MDITALIIQLASGAAGGNIAGKLLKNFSLGPVGNSIVGILGGGLGGQILGMLGIGGSGQGGPDLASILSSIAGGGVGGGVLMAIIGVIRKAIGK
ncbi:MAG: hypothetical protein BWY71_01141 [Planctomycetes bacterium ADurb.Bin412]|nr:MAG: hypothetical protein BWY71_01141 [Planctomycetes bacterium ADurb.Bin412]